MRVSIDLPLTDIVPPPELFTHPSTVHGQAHVARVMVHAFRLLEATGFAEETARLWASVYLHDIARKHDGRCYVHGANAVKRLDDLPEVRELFARGGVQPDDYAIIATAVTQHSRREELPATHPHSKLTALLKDADGLDRVRLGDLDPSYLRHPEAREMVPFAATLFRQTNAHIPVGADHFARLLDAVDACLSCPSNT